MGPVLSEPPAPPSPSPTSSQSAPCRCPHCTPTAAQRGAGCPPPTEWPGCQLDPLTFPSQTAWSPSPPNERSLPFVFQRERERLYGWKSWRPRCSFRQETGPRRVRGRKKDPLPQPEDSGGVKIRPRRRPAPNEAPTGPAAGSRCGASRRAPGLSLPKAQATSCLSEYALAAS